MVDYTKPAMRDESWRRWKGGAKLSEALKVFYTTPAAAARIASMNAVTPVKATLGRNGEVKKFGRYRTQMLANSYGMRNYAKALARAQGQMRRAASTMADSSALPGRDAPRR